MQENENLKKINKRKKIEKDEEMAKNEDEYKWMLMSHRWQSNNENDEKNEQEKKNDEWRN